MRFPAVFLPEERALRNRISVTFGRAFNVCRRAGFLYALHKGGAAQHPLERGSALHRVLELATRAMVEEDEPEITPDLVKAIVNEVLADADYWAPFEEHDYIRESAFRWASETRLVPEDVIAVERMFVLDIDGWHVRMKIDLAVLLEGGAAVRIDDYKSSRNPPPYDAIGRKRSDGTIAAKDYQLVLYALGVAFGRPVRIVTRLDGSREEIIEPFPLADRAQRFHLRYVFPGIERRDDGLMLTRDVDLTKLELYEYLESLRAQLAQIANAEATGDWPATYGTHCVECSARTECPIPVHLRDMAGMVNSREEAAHQAERNDKVRERLATTDREILLWLKAQPLGSRRLVYGRDKVIEVLPTRSEEIVDREGMFAAIEEAVDYGRPFDRTQFVKVKEGVRTKRRVLTEGELEELAELRQKDGNA